MMSQDARGPVAGATLLGRVAPTMHDAFTPPGPPEVDHEDRRGVGSPELFRALAEVKGQAQFLLYLADQIEESLGQLNSEPDMTHTAFLCKVMTMYSGQLESKHQGLGDRIAETCQEIYLTVRELDVLE